MPSSYTVNLGIEKIATGEQSGTWGDTTNVNFDIIDQAVNGAASVTLASAGTSGSPNTLAITNGATSDGRNKFIEFIDGGDLGATAYVQLTPNDAEKIVFIRNSLSGSRSILLFQGTYDPSRDLEVPAGVVMIVKFPGSGSVSTVTNALQDLQLGGLTTTAAINVGGLHQIFNTVNNDSLEIWGGQFNNGAYISLKGDSAAIEPGAARVYADEFYLRNAAGTVTALEISSNGNLVLHGDISFTTDDGTHTIWGGTDGNGSNIRLKGGSAGLFPNHVLSNCSGFDIFNLSGTTTWFTIDSSGNVGVPNGNLTVSGTLSKGSGSFKIDHPLKPDTHHLVHSFVEGPRADNLYRGTAQLVNGYAQVNLDEAAGMTPGTWVALNRDPNCFVQNEDGWTQVRGSVADGVLFIEAQEPVNHRVTWLVIGERQDAHIRAADFTDDDGRVIVEPEKVPEEGPADASDET